MNLDSKGLVRFEISVNETQRFVYPEDVGATIIQTLKSAAERNLTAKVTKVVMSVPAEFNTLQRNYTRKTAELTGWDLTLPLSLFDHLVQDNKFMCLMSARS